MAMVKLTKYTNGQSNDVSITIIVFLITVYLYHCIWGHHFIMTWRMLSHMQL